MSESTKSFIGRDAILGILFVFVASFAAMRYIAHDRVGASLGLAAAAVFVGLFLREVTAGQSRRTVIFETILAIVVAAIGIAVGWIQFRLRD